MNKIKDTIRKIAPFVKNYKKGFIFAIILFTALAPMVEGFIITQLTNDSLNTIRGVEGASVNFKYILKVLVILVCIYLGNVLSTYGASFLLTNSILIF